MVLKVILSELFLRISVFFHYIKDRRKREKMKTPKEWQNNIRDNILTEEMLEAALDSVNKRAKNWRNRKQEYGRWHHAAHDYAARAAACETEMYQRKDFLLSVLEPACIHKEFHGYERRRIRGSDASYALACGNAAAEGRIAYAGGYYERDEQDDFPSFVPFADLEDFDRPRIRRYLFYLIGEHSFHVPLEDRNYGKYEHLPVIFIGRMETQGKEITELASMDFVKKVMAMIRQGCRFQFSVRIDEAEKERRCRIGETDEESFIRSYRRDHLEHFAPLYREEILYAMRQEVIRNVRSDPAELAEKEKTDCLRRAEEAVSRMKNLYQKAVQAEGRSGKSIRKQARRAYRHISRVRLPQPYEDRKTGPFMDKVLACLQMDMSIADLVRIFPDEAYSGRLAEALYLETLLSAEREAHPEWAVFR
jgi:hypothetical protein